MGEDERWVQLPMYMTAPLPMTSAPFPCPQLSNVEAKRKFNLMAQKAIQEGLLTPLECYTIRRAGTRKIGNWVRHLRNLRDYLNYKRKGETWEESSGN